MTLKPKSDWAWSLSGATAIFGIIVPLLVIQLMPVHDNEFGANQRNYYLGACHIALLALPAVGVIAGIVAGIRRSRCWLLSAAANALLLTAEYLSGGYS